MSKKSKVILIVFSACILVCLSFGLFFWQDMQWATETPKPNGLVMPAAGTLVSTEHAKPLLLHFYSPDCNCSAFAEDHLKELAKRYGKQIDFVKVNVSSEPDADPIIKTLTDSANTLAKHYGVFCTPTAVLLTKEGKLFYRGNYNSSRYCMESQTQFARIAIDSLIAGSAAGIIKPPKPFGCAIDELALK